VAELELNQCVIGDCVKVLARMPDKSISCCVTSPPYWRLRDYGHAKQVGLEQTPDQYVRRLVRVFEEVRRVLRDDGTAWINLGDTYAAGGNGGGGSFKQERRSWRGSQQKGWRSPPRGLKRKDLVGIPWRVALALQAAGWYLRSDIIWSKSNASPKSVRDRPSTSHEYVFLLSKRPTYYFDPTPLMEPSTTPPDRWPTKSGENSLRGEGSIRPRGNLGADEPERYYSEMRNARTVWTIATQPFEGAHFATMPEQLAQRCICAGAPPGGIVLDPFFGSGTVGRVAESLDRRWLGIELVPDYAEIIARRTKQMGFQFTETVA
jgi:DNA modification methylase